MKTFDEKTTVVGVSELRDIDKILKEAKKHKVVIEKRNKLLAVLMDIKKYEKFQHLLDIVEDYILGYLAKERDEASDLSDYIDINEL